MVKCKRCYKDGNIATKQKMLERRKSYKNTENVTEAEILLIEGNVGKTENLLKEGKCWEDGKCWKDGNLTKERKMLGKTKILLK